jgi:hypothetical protein
VEYDGGDRLVLLGGGCCVSLPPQAPLAAGAPFRTEFGLLLQTRDKAAAEEAAAGTGVQDAVVVGEEADDAAGVKTHLARSQRIYVDGQLVTATSAFLTAGGMPYR